MGFKLNNYIPLNKWYWIYFLSVGISVFIYGKYRCEYKDNTDYLAIEPIKGIDGWIISHIIAFAIAGVLFPDTFYTTMILGILWELFEMYLGITKPDILDGVTNCGTEKSEIKYIPTQAEIGDYALYLGKASIEIEIEKKEYLIVPQSAIIILIRDDIEKIVLTESK